MEVRTLESDTRMRFLLGNNPMGEMIKIVSRECKKIEKKKCLLCPLEKDIITGWGNTGCPVLLTDN